ncbi:MAG: carbonic anhydrase [Nitrospinota bacterium]
MTDSFDSADKAQNKNQTKADNLAKDRKQVERKRDILFNENGAIETASLLDEEGSSQPNLGAILIALLAIMVSVSTLFSTLSQTDSRALEKIAALNEQLHTLETRLGKTESVVQNDRTDRTKMELRRMLATAQGISNIAGGEAKSVLSRIEKELSTFIDGKKSSGHSADWGYSEAGGPDHWGMLSEKYKACSEGKNQSPVNLSHMIESSLGDIEFAYASTPLNVENNGHTIQVNYSPGSYIVQNGVRYNLLQFHFHTPSENQINGVSFPLEGHLVHADADGNLAVVSVLFYDGRANPFLNQIWKHMPAEAHRKVTIPDKTLNVAALLPQEKKYYSFSGSLTTPPCTEGVLWMVLKDPVEISEEQVIHFHSVIHHDNNRPVQPLYARTILKN